MRVSTLNNALNVLIIMKSCRRTNKKQQQNSEEGIEEISWRFRKLVMTNSQLGGLSRAYMGPAIYRPRTA